MLEYRVCWSAGSNISFKGETDWYEAPNEDDTTEDIENQLYNSGGGGGSICDGLEMALEGSGFDWHVETREVGTGDE